MKKKKLWIAILVAFVVLASSVVYLNRAVIFQRGNPIPYLVAAARISEKNPYVAVNEAKGIYISKRGECPELLEYYQEKTGMEFVEQAGSSYLFTDGSRNEVASSEVYWGRYTVWVLPTMEAAENSDAEQYDAKPVIYLYPEKETEVTVKLNYAGELTCTYPAYNDGWNVSASPDGTLTDADGQTYNYLYWEGVNSVAYDFSEGFCVAGSDTAVFLENALNQLGLTRKEANEFIVYWLPLMKENPYNLIAFQSDSYTQSAQVSIPFFLTQLCTGHNLSQNGVFAPSMRQPVQFIISGVIITPFSFVHRAAVFSRRALSFASVAILASHFSQSSPQQPISLFIYIPPYAAFSVFRFRRGKWINS